MWLQTELDNTKTYYQLINHKNHNFLEKKNSPVMKEREILHKKIEKGLRRYLFNVDLKLIWADFNYDFERDRLILTTTLNVIGLLNCPITKWSIKTRQINE